MAERVFQGMVTWVLSNSSFSVAARVGGILNKIGLVATRVSIQVLRGGKNPSVRPNDSQTSRLHNLCADRSTHAMTNNCV